MAVHIFLKEIMVKNLAMEFSIKMIKMRLYGKIPLKS
jgi:hypothetical protein